MSSTVSPRVDATPGRVPKAAPRRPRGRGKSAGWMPNQHGAWAMLITPWVLGALWAARNGEFNAAVALLFAFWMVGYFTFFAGSQWLKSRFKPRYLPAMRAYGAASALLGIVVLVLQPGWWSWALLFGPLTAGALWLCWRRRERALVSGAATIAAACLLPVVVGSDGVTRLSGMPELAAIAGVCFGYFFGTVLYIKTMIRERGNVWWIVASVAWHAGWALGCLWLPEPLPGVWLSAFFMLLTARAFLLPLLGPMRGRNLRPRSLGFGEVAATLVLLAAMVMA